MATADNVFNNLGHFYRPSQPFLSLPQLCHTTSTAYTGKLPLAPKPSLHLDTLTLPLLPTHPSGFSWCHFLQEAFTDPQAKSDLPLAVLPSLFSMLLNLQNTRKNDNQKSGKCMGTSKKCLNNVLRCYKKKIKVKHTTIIENWWFLFFVISALTPYRHPINSYWINESVQGV